MSHKSLSNYRATKTMLKAYLIRVTATDSNPVNSNYREFICVLGVYDMKIFVLTVFMGQKLGVGETKI